MCYPQCLHLTPESLDRLLITVIDYQIRPLVEGQLHTSLGKFGIEFVVDRLKIIYCDRFALSDIEPMPLYSTRRRPLDLTQHQLSIPYIRYFLHTQARANAYHLYKFDEMLEIGAFVEKAEDCNEAINSEKDRSDKSLKTESR